MSQRIQQNDPQWAITQLGHLIDMWMPMKRLHSRIPGISIGIALNGELLYSKGFGYADSEQKIKATPDTLYRCASVSKMFTAVALLQLQEQGKLDLDDPVVKYVPWFTGKNEKGDLARITIRQLLTHTGGLFRDGEEPYWESREFPQTLKGTFTKRALVYENNIKFGYSNHGFSVLGDVIETASDESYDAYIGKHIFSALQMRNSHTDLPDNALPNMAMGWGRWLPECDEVPQYPPVKTHAYAPATGLISNVRDLTIFLTALVVENGKPRRILARESQKEMVRPQVYCEDDDFYGLGIEIANYKNHTVVGHSGGIAGYRSAALVDPKEKMSVVVLANALTANAPGIAHGLFEGLYHLMDAREMYQAKKKDKFLSAYEGVYRGQWADTAIAAVGDKLVAFIASVDKPVPRNRVLLEPIGHAHTFRIEGGGGAWGNDGELARFGDFKNGVPQSVLLGGKLLKRIEIAA